MRSSILLSAVLTVLVVHPAAGQTKAPPPLPLDTASSGSGLQARLLTAVAGAALGAGLGFFASQVAQGDWEEGSGSSRIDRGVWAAVGGGVGFALGLRFPIGRGGATPTGRGGLPTGRWRLGGDEIRESGVTNAFEAIRLLRPDWLSLRGTQVWRQATQGTSTDPRATPDDMGALDDSPLPVYLDDQPLGDLSTLTSVNAHDIGAVYFLDAAQATVRWGSGHGRGAILIITAG